MVTAQLDQPQIAVRVRDADPAAYLETVYQAFQRAEESGGGAIDRFYGIGGYVVRLRFAGPALVPRITPALEHLATQPSPAPALTICLWDSASTRTNLPPPPWVGYDVYTPRGDVRGFSNEHIRTAHFLGPDVLNMLDTRRGLAVYCTRDALQLPAYESGSPLRLIFHWWFRRHGRQFVHGGAVGRPDGGVLLAGKGGVGKSTTALACLDSELFYASDDYCLIAAQPAPYAYSIYNSAKVNPNDIHRIPHLAEAVRAAKILDTQKALVFLHEHYPGRLASGFPIRALLLPRISGHLETRLAPASPTLGLRALVMSTIRQLAGAGKEALQLAGEFVKQVPCYYLELGTDTAQIPQVIGDLLSRE